MDVEWILRDVVANARLDGREVPVDWVEDLRSVLDGRRDADALARDLIQSLTAPDRVL